MSLWPSGCNGPRSRNARWVSDLTDNSIVRWFKALPSRPFGPANFPRSATNARNADNWSLIEAREVIPQPQLQPITSKEIRRCLQYAQLCRAPRKPFLQFCVLGSTGDCKERKKETKKKKNEDDGGETSEPDRQQRVKQKNIKNIMKKKTKKKSKH